MKFDELVEIMARLRNPENGCPWDLEQTPETLKPYIIEECYEVIEAIENKDIEDLRGELGDLMFQILFQAHIQQELGNFDINDVIEGICVKMRRRHPHIFSDAIAKTPAEVRVRWEAIKKEEFKDRESVLDGTPRSLPALLRARRIGKKAANVGFDWPDSKGAWDKVGEEIAELEEAMSNGDEEQIAREIGDTLFALVNVARHMKVNPEDALNDTTEKFINRFRYIEKSLTDSKKNIEEEPLEALDKLWEEAKSKVE